MKSPGSGSGGGKAPGGKTKAGGKGKGGKFPGKKVLRREYKGEARREEASARHEEHDAAHRRAEAEHYRQEAAKAEREGYKKEAEYDLAKARRETAAARRDTARARRNQAKAVRNRHKAAHVGLANPSAIADGWILGGNDWHRGCAAVALANSLLAATGLRVTGRDILDLYSLTADDPDTGAGVLATLEAAAEYGLGGMWPVNFGSAPQSRTALACAVARPGPAQRVPTTPRGIAPRSLILDLRLQQAQRHQPVWDASPSPDWGAHAGVLAGDRVITWGREVPVTGDFLSQRVAGAWLIEWPELKGADA